MPSFAFRRLFPFLAACSLLLASACSTPKEPRFVRASDLGQLGEFKFDRPLVIELMPGDIIPLEVKVDGPLVKSPDTMVSIPLVARQRFFLRIDGSGLKTSLDGKSFDRAPPLRGNVSVRVRRDQGWLPSRDCHSNADSVPGTLIVHGRAQNRPAFAAVESPIVLTFARPSVCEGARKGADTLPSRRLALSLRASLGFGGAAVLRLPGKSVESEHERARLC